MSAATSPPEFLTSVLCTSGLELNDKTRPKVTLTFAQSLDGKIAGKGGKQLILSGQESMIMTHWYLNYTKRVIKVSNGAAIG